MSAVMEGATRIIRSDAHNVAVERYVKITPKAKDGERARASLKLHQRDHEL